MTMMMMMSVWASKGWIKKIVIWLETYDELYGYFCVGC